MSVLIKGIDMPKAGTTITVYELEGKLYASVQETELAPLVEVPTSHGRLGDLDRLYKHIKAECNIYGKPTIGFEDGNKVLDIIANTPTVIEAEEEAAQTVIRDMCDNESINIDKITEAHEKLGYERGWRDGYAEAITDTEKRRNSNAQMATYKR